MRDTWARVCLKTMPCALFWICGGYLQILYNKGTLHLLRDPLGIINSLRKIDREALVHNSMLSGSLFLPEGQRKTTACVFYSKGGDTTFPF